MTRLRSDKQRQDYAGAGEPRMTNREPQTMQLSDLLADMLPAFGERYELSSRLKQAWRSTLPAGLLEHCRLDEVSGGVLKVQVDAPSYMHELRLCKGQLRDALNKAAPGLKIRDIKTRIGN